jgi:hypothetical protein
VFSDHSIVAVQHRITYEVGVCEHNINKAWGSSKELKTPLCHRLNNTLNECSSSVKMLVEILSKTFYLKQTQGFFEFVEFSKPGQSVFA